MGASSNSPSQCYYPLPPSPIPGICHQYLFIHLGEERQCKATTMIIIIVIIYYRVFRNSFSPKYIKLIVIRIILMKMYVSCSFKKYIIDTLSKNIKIMSIKTHVLRID